MDFSGKPCAENNGEELMTPAFHELRIRAVPMSEYTWFSVRSLVQREMYELDFPGIQDHIRRALREEEHKWSVYGIK